MASQQRIIRFLGDVQGVGFRYTACRVAQGFDVTGYVRNEPDGSVLCVAEGDAPEIDQFIEALGRQMAGCIRQTQQQSAPPSGQFSGFSVRY